MWEDDILEDDMLEDDTDEDTPSRRALIRPIGIVLIIALVGGGAYLYPRTKTTVHRTEDGRFRGITFALLDAQIEDAELGLPPAAPARSTIRIATFDLDGMGDDGRGNDGLGNDWLESPQISDVLVPLLSRFDVVALQGIRTGNRSTLMRLVDQINAAGREYTVESAPGEAAPDCAFLFDQSSIEIDHSLVRPIEDPLGRFAHRPLVALFRVRGLEPSEAFTFKLVNVHANTRNDSNLGVAEEDLLDDVYRAVRDDRSNEDDVILLGGLGVNTGRTDLSSRILDITWAIGNTPTRVDGGQPVDNILFDRLATCEFTGRADVLDIEREFNLAPSAVRAISSHLPVWAEFRAHEGTVLDRVASTPPKRGG